MLRYLPLPALWPSLSDCCCSKRDSSNSSLLNAILFPRSRCRGETFFDQAGRSSAEKISPADLPSSSLGQLGGRTSLHLVSWLKRPPSFNLQEVNPDSRQNVRVIAQERFFGRWNEGEELKKVVDEIPLIGSRMRDLAKERFQEFDKLRSEAELREAVSPAVVILAVALIIRWSPWWGLLLPFVIWLQNEARKLRVQANTVAIEAVIDVPGLYPSRDDPIADAVEEAISITAREARKTEEREAREAEAREAYEREKREAKEADAREANEREARERA